MLYITLRGTEFNHQFTTNGIDLNEAYCIFVLKLIGYA